MAFTTVLLHALLLSTVYGYHLVQPTKTPDADAALLEGTSPRPTTPPALPRDLVGRAVSSIFVGWFAPDNTCGFVSGDPALPKTCNPGEFCFVQTDLPGPEFAAVRCCADTGCSAKAHCVNSWDYTASCDSNCKADVNTVKCTQSNLPFCVPYTMRDPAGLMFSCDSAHATTTYPILTTFLGEQNAIEWTSLYTVTSIPNKPTKPARTTTTTSSKSADAASSVQSELSSSGSDSSTNIGAIVGGAVGAFAILVAGIAACVYFVLRAKRNHPKPMCPPDSAEGWHQYPAPMSGYPGPPQSPGLEYAGAYVEWAKHDKSVYPELPATPGRPYTELPASVKDASGRYSNWPNAPPFGVAELPVTSHNGYSRRPSARDVKVRPVTRDTRDTRGSMSPTSASTCDSPLDPFMNHLHPQRQESASSRPSPASPRHSWEPSCPPSAITPYDHSNPLEDVRAPRSYARWEEQPGPMRQLPSRDRSASSTTRPGPPSPHRTYSLYESEDRGTIEAARLRLEQHLKDVGA